MALHVGALLKVEFNGERKFIAIKQINENNNNLVTLEDIKFSSKYIIF